jgi:hypothetical protein
MLDLHFTPTCPAGRNNDHYRGAFWCRRDGIDYTIESDAEQGTDAPHTCWLVSAFIDDEQWNAPDVLTLDFAIVLCRRAATTGGPQHVPGWEHA